jgi:hypothetical protein
MADSLIVTIEVEKLRQRLADSEGHLMTADDVTEWLQARGFVCRGWTWRCEEISLDVLAPGEYRIVRRA